MAGASCKDDCGAHGRLSRPSTWHLGWSLLLTWVFCVFYFRSTDVSCEGAGLDPIGASLASDLVHAGAPLAFSVLTLVIIALFELRIRSLVDHRRLLVACPVLTALGTLSILLLAGGSAGEVAFWVGSLLTGVGSGPLWIMWGELYSRLEQGVSETTATVAAVLAMGCALICVSLAGWVAVAVVSLLPLASGLMLARARHVTRGRFPCGDQRGRPGGLDVEQRALRAVGVCPRARPAEPVGVPAGLRTRGPGHPRG